MSSYCDPHIERMPLEDLHALQADRLKSVVRYVYDHFAFYLRRFVEAHVEPGNIKITEDGVVQIIGELLDKKGISPQEIVLTMGLCKAEEMPAKSSARGCGGDYRGCRRLTGRQREVSQLHRGPGHEERRGAKPVRARCAGW